MGRKVYGPDRGGWDYNFKHEMLSVARQVIH